MTRDCDQIAAGLICVGFDSTTTSSELQHLIERGVSSVILFDRNYESRDQLRELCAEIKSLADRPILICVDHEGGRVQRFRDGFTPIPSMREVGATGDIQYAREIGSLMAKELRDVNIDMNLVPVMDVDTNPDNPVIGNRSLSSNPEIVSQYGCALIDAMQSEGVAACAKHFPGHGDTSLDSHHDLPRVRLTKDRLNQFELVPFCASIESSVSSVMTAHVVYDALDSEYPATLSCTIVRNMLREQLKFNGLVISDDMEMKALDQFDDAGARAVRAGVDLLILSRDYNKQCAAIDQLAAAIDEGTISVDRCTEASRHLGVVLEQYVKPAHAVHRPA